MFNKNIFNIIERFSEYLDYIKKHIAQLPVHSLKVIYVIMIMSLKKDYEDMQLMIYGNYPSFEDIMNGIKKLEDNINNLGKNGI